MTPRDTISDALDLTAGLRDWAADEIDQLADRILAALDNAGYEIRRRSKPGEFWADLEGAGADEV